MVIEHFFSDMTDDRTRDHSDGVYAWLVAMAAMAEMFLCATNYGTYGVLFVEFCDYFGASKGDVAWIGSIQTLMCCSGNANFSYFS